jgi:homospermidine synthase
LLFKRANDQVNRRCSNSVHCIERWRARQGYVEKDGWIAALGWGTIGSWMVTMRKRGKQGNKQARNQLTFPSDLP